MIAQETEEAMDQDEKFCGALQVLKRKRPE